MKKGNHGVSYEQRDLSVMALATVGIGLVVSAVFVHFAVSLVFYCFSLLAQSQGVELSTVVHQESMTKPPEPRLQVDPARDLIEMRVRESESLHSYGWVNREQGIVRIPIEQAMRLMVERQGKKQ